MFACVQEQSPYLPPTFILYPSRLTGTSASSFGAGTGPILLSNVRCIGNEARLEDCPFSIGRMCSHSEDAGVRCQVATGIMMSTVMLWQFSSVTIQLVQGSIQCGGGGGGKLLKSSSFPPPPPQKKRFCDCTTTDQYFSLGQFLCYYTIFAFLLHEKSI